MSITRERLYITIKDTEAVQEVSFKILKPKNFKFIKVLKRSTPSPEVS
jgi:hypothetical protein